LLPDVLCTYQIDVISFEMCFFCRDNLNKKLERLASEQIHLKDDFNTASNRLRDVREEKLKVLAELNKVKGLRMERRRLMEQISQAQLDFQVNK
jgi:hypothetical protein